jgi:hypothetical protein
MWLVFQNVIILSVMASLIYFEAPAQGQSGPVAAILIAWISTVLLAKIIDFVKVRRPSGRRGIPPNLDSNT